MHCPSSPLCLKRLLLFSLRDTIVVLVVPNSIDSIETQAANVKQNSSIAYMTVELKRGRSCYSVNKTLSKHLSADNISLLAREIFQNMALVVNPLVSSMYV